MKTLPQGSDAQASELEKALRKMRRLAVHGSNGADWDGRVQYSAQMHDGDVYNITMVMTTNTMKEIAHEIREAANLFREYVRLRFPRLSVMDSFQIFSVSFNRANHAIDFVDEKLAILSDYLCIDVSLLRVAVTMLKTTRSWTVTLPSMITI